MYTEAYNQKTNERERRGQKAQLDTGKHQVECLKLGVRVVPNRAEHPLPYGACAKTEKITIQCQFRNMIRANICMN